MQVAPTYPKLARAQQEERAMRSSRFPLSEPECIPCQKEGGFAQIFRGALEPTGFLRGTQVGIIGLGQGVAVNPTLSEPQRFKIARSS